MHTNPSSPTRRRGARRVSWRARIAGLSLIAVLAGTAGSTAAGAGAVGGPISIGETGCGTPAAHMPAGPILFTVTSTDTRNAYASVYVINLSGGLVFAEIPSLAPAKVLPLSTTLSAGTYALRCVFTDGTVQTSPPFTLTGTAVGAVTGYPPMGDLELEQPVRAYTAYVEAALPTLLADSTTLNADIAAGNLTAAKTDWLTAHLDYERLGAAYNAFGEYDGEINGLATGLPQGTDTPGWTGFFAIEHALWSGRSAAAVQPLTKNLVSKVKALIRDFPSEEVDPGDLPLRAHEILENSLQFQLTGIADYGSGTTLATVYANTQGTTEILSILKSLLAPRDQSLLPTIDQDLKRLQSDLLAQRASNGTWTPLADVAPAQRRRIDSDTGALLEELAPIPNLLTPRNSA
ncbi:EfeM/EfeO family lipoprotein [Actinospica sp.]|jgi:high-affinity iron transporter|uniref:EfeM/EfeO family lipoprotein n=1 Tax=Actinospica sp. TaxID=1872142 RepID=UPI002C5727D7|nr:EfeM/EfeO family lipoprotein [Actinospica sp.]HWG28569.1 EfeM/EfeO family lipoprotein [Actinospica sp.]